MQVLLATSTKQSYVLLKALKPGQVFSFWTPDPQALKEEAYLILDNPSQSKEGRVCFADLATGTVMIRDGDTLVVQVSCQLLKYN